MISNTRWASAGPAVPARGATASCTLTDGGGGGAKTESPSGSASVPSSRAGVLIVMAPSESKSVGGRTMPASDVETRRRGCGLGWDREWPLSGRCVSPVPYSLVNRDLLEACSAGGGAWGCDGRSPPEIRSHRVRNAWTSCPTVGSFPVAIVNFRVTSSTLASTPPFQGEGPASHHRDLHATIKALRGSQGSAVNKAHPESLI